MSDSDIPNSQGGASKSGREAIKTDSGPAVIGAVDPLARIVGRSAAMADLRRIIAKIASKEISVLIRGETGTGRSLVARTLHDLGRPSGPFVSVPVGTLSVPLAQADLFGHERGAFTGAAQRKAGFFELAQYGTVYFDSIDIAPSDIQPLFVRFLTDRTFLRVGSVMPLQVDVRVIASISSGRASASHLKTDLLSLLTDGITIDVPPLREHPEDIPDLVRMFLATHGVTVNITSEAMRCLENYDYPGNVRELHGILKRASALSEGHEITPEDLGIPATASVPQADSRALQDEVRRLTAELDTIRVGSIVATPIWQGRSFPVEKDYCFVLMPFADSRDLQSVYERHVKPVIESRCGLRCERADDIHDVSGIMQSVWESINRARLIVADMTGRNPNVFYELGIAHTLGKPVIMITQSMEYVPFDLKHLRCIIYQYKPSNINDFEQSLERTVKTVLSSLDSISLRQLVSTNSLS